MKNIAFGLAAGILTGLLFTCAYNRERPIVETKDERMTREVAEYLKENGHEIGPIHQPFRGIPFLENAPIVE